MKGLGILGQPQVESKKRGRDFGKVSRDDQ